LDGTMLIKLNRETPPRFLKSLMTGQVNSLQTWIRKSKANDINIAGKPPTTRAPARFRPAR
jgi:hypothetical protein